MSRNVAVIDIGSNSIKVLVATRAADGSLTTLLSRTLDARISVGISRAEPVLSAEGMQRGLEAVRTLLDDATPYAPAVTMLIATSAVRDARNGGEFRARMREATGHDIRILSGAEEASLIGRGLTCDPALHHLRDFYVFDLGGGSLECLSFRRRQLEQAASLQLGCVRLTERFVADPGQPLDRSARDAIKDHTRDELETAGFRFDLPTGATLVGTGGTVATVRSILGAREGRAFEQTASFVTVGQLDQHLGWLGAMSLADRRQVPGLPPQRADIFPTALATLLAVAEAARAPGFQHSLYNLRYGLADEALNRP